MFGYQLCYELTQSEVTSTLGLSFLPLLYTLSKDHFDHGVL